MPGDVGKVMLHGTKAELDAAQPAIERHAPRATRSMNEFFEISDPDATKWSGISSVFDLLDVDPARAVGPGDAENDVVWMRESVTSAVRNTRFDTHLPRCRRPSR